MTLTRLIRRVVAPALFCATLIPLLGSFGLLRRTIAVDPDRIQFQSGLAYSFDAPDSTWPWRVPADTPETPGTSRLALYVDGKPIGPPHSLHDDIVRKGGGSYSHWQSYVLFSMPDGSDPRRGRSHLTVRFGPTLNPAIALLLSLVLGWLAVRALCFRNDRWQRLGASSFWKRLAMRFAGWGALIGALMVGHSLSEAASRWALFTLGCLACLALRRWSGAAAAQVSASPRASTVIGLVAALLSVSTSLIAVAALSTPFNTDAPYYFTRPSEMFSPRGGEVSATTPLFGLIFGFIQLIGLEGAALIGLQIAVRAAAVFTASRLVASGSLWLGVVLGLFLGIDPVGAALTTMYATESLHSSSLILAAVAIASLSPIASLPRGISIGVFVGLTGLFRPSGIPLLALAIVFLVWNARASRAFRGALAGVAIAVLLVSSVARLQRGSWHPIGGGGGFAYAWPLLVHQLLDPANGPQSLALTSAIRSCDPRWPQEPIRIETDSNERIPAIKTCLVSSGRPIDEVFKLFAASYREAIVAQPVRFLASVRDEFLNYLGTTLAHNILLGAQFATDEDLSLICEPSAANPLFARAPALRNGEANERVMDTLAFLCPAPRPMPQFAGLAREATMWFRGVFQPYFYVLEPPFFRQAVSNVTDPWWMGLCAVSFGALVLGISRGWAFRIAALSVLMVGTAAATVALTHLTTARYLAPLSPWFLALSALLVFAFARDVSESVLEFARIARSPETPGLHGIAGAPVWKPLWQTKPAALGADLKALRELLTTRRPLLLELTRREILDRHAGQLLGAGWALFQPLLVVGVYLFVFGYIFKGRIGGGAAPGFDYPVFLLAGLIPWLGFQESMSRSSDVIVINANLVKQVVFPIEVLPVRSALAAMFTQSILLLGLLAYVSVRTGSVPWTYLILPVFLVLQFAAFAGLNYFLAAFGVFFRDTRELVQAFAVMGIYFLPTIYSPENAPAWLLSLLALNPFSHFIWCAQDVLFFGAIHHPWSWLVASCLSLVVLVTGFRFFRRASTVFGNLL